MNNENKPFEDSNRLKLYSAELLNESKDEVLQKIVEQAAELLDTPIALVSIFLDQIQYFKAHIGLPEILKTTRSTARDVSFCQFVVQHGEPFEINDAKNDARIPDFMVKEFNIQAYLGIPIKINNTIVGSLCVLDTERHNFDQEAYDNLKKLAEEVNIRLEELTQSKERSALRLAINTVDPALKELTHAIKPIDAHLKISNAQLTAINSFLKLAPRVLPEKGKDSRLIHQTYESANKAAKVLEEHLLEMEMYNLDALDSLSALNDLLSDSNESRLPMILMASQDLTRQETNSAGGFPLPGYVPDKYIKVKGSLAISIISNCLLLLASSLRKNNSEKGIKLKVQENETDLQLQFITNELAQQSLEELLDQLNNLIGPYEPNLVLSTGDHSCNISFKIAV